MTESWFDRPIDRLLATYTQRVDKAYLDLILRLDRAGARAAPDFGTIWPCFAAWFSQPIEGVRPADDRYEFGVGFIDGDPERADLEIAAPASLTPPLVEVGLVRILTIDHPDEAATSLGVGQVGIVLHYDLTNVWRTLPANVAQHWVNSNPYGWDSLGSRAFADESLAGTQTTTAFHLASHEPPLRVELMSSSREDTILLGH